MSVAVGSLGRHTCLTGAYFPSMVGVVRGTPARLQSCAVWLGCKPCGSPRPVPFGTTLLVSLALAAQSTTHKGPSGSLCISGATLMHPLAHHLVEPCPALILFGKDQVGR